MSAVLQRVTTQPAVDGSVVEVERIDHHSSLIIRRVDGYAVWGQVFVAGPRDGMTAAEAHAVQVDGIVAGIVANPDRYHRWNLPGGAR